MCAVGNQMQIDKGPKLKPFAKHFVKNQGSSADGFSL